MKPIGKYVQQFINYISRQPKQSIASCLTMVICGGLVISFGIEIIISAVEVWASEEILWAEPFNLLVADSLFGILIIMASLPLFLISRLLLENHRLGVISATILGISMILAYFSNIGGNYGLIFGIAAIVSTILGQNGRTSGETEIKDSPTSTESIVKFCAQFCALLCTAILVGFFVYVAVRGIKYLNLDFITDSWATYPQARNAIYARFLADIGELNSYAIQYPQYNLIEAANSPIGGLNHQIIGTLLLVAGCAMIASPVGLGAGIYLAEYAPQNVVTKTIRLFIITLAGIPSIIIGLVGLSFFVQQLGWGRSLLGGSLSLAFMILPWTVTVTEEAIKTVPRSYKDASLALGATEWQTTRRVVVNAAMPGIITGIILGIGKAMGETAVVMLTAGGWGATELPKELSLTNAPIPNITTWILGASQNLYSMLEGVGIWEGMNFALSGCLLLLLMFLAISLTTLIIRNYYMKKLGQTI